MAKKYYPKEYEKIYNGKCEAIKPGDIMIEFTAPEDRVIRSGKVTDRVTVKVTDPVNDNERDLLLDFVLIKTA